MTPTAGPPDRLPRRLLHALLARWAASPWAGDWVLRGGLMTQLWAGPHRRETRDADFLALHPFDADETLRRVQGVLALDPGDGVSFDPDTLHAGVIWQETDFPGLRFAVGACVDGRPAPLQIDVGFGDPLVPPAGWIDYPCVGAPPARVLAARPELMAAWKLDGLFDHGPRRWQAKDLFDLHLLTTCCTLEPGALTEAVRVAFATHANPLGQVPGVLYAPAWWQAGAAREKWARFRASAGVEVPEDLAAVAAAVAAALRPALQPLVALP
jgi:hypothetical protein